MPSEKAKTNALIGQCRKAAAMLLVDSVEVPLLEPGDADAAGMQMAALLAAVAVRLANQADRIGDLERSNRALRENMRQVMLDHIMASQLRRARAVNEELRERLRAAIHAAADAEEVGS